MASYSKARAMAAKPKGGAAFASSSPPAPTKDSVTTREATTRKYDARMQNPSLSLYSGHQPHPDVVVRLFGQWEGLAFLDRMERQHPFLHGLLDQRAVPVVAIERVIVPGDPNDDMSRKLAEDARRMWKAMKCKEAILMQLVRKGIGSGISPVEKVWGQCETTNLIAPIELYDIPPHAVKFGPDGEEYFLTATNPRGEIVEPGRFMYYRNGSRWTLYGDPVLAKCYHAIHAIQSFTDLASESVEMFGKPFPHFEYDPESLSPTEAANVEEIIKEQFANYLITPSKKNGETASKLLGENITATGAAGKAELEFIRYYVGQCYIAIVGSQQRQDKGASSKALEEVSVGFRDEKIPIASDALDEVLTTQWLNDVGAVNWPNQPRALWPQFVSDASEITTGLNGNQANLCMSVMLRLAARQITSTVAEQLLTSVGIPQARVTKMVKSTVDERDSLIVAPDMAGEESKNAAQSADREEIDEAKAA